jgi:hypothetical protein
MKVPLRFRLLRLDHNDASAAEIQAEQRRYLDFVDQQEFSPHDDLPKFFALDFFHDGPMEELRFSQQGRTFNMRIQARRIDGWWAWFRCEFRDVVWFSWTTERRDRANDPLADIRHDLEYRYAEVDTLEEQLAFYRRNFESHLEEHGKRFHSLLIELAPTGMMGLVFAQAVVWPEEPLAWELFRQRSEVSLGLYEKGER